MELLRQDGTPALVIAQMDGEAIEMENWQYGQVWSGVDEITIDLADLHWYGMGGLGHQQYPLEKLALFNAPYLTSDNGGTGLMTILAPFWWTSNGVGIEVLADEFELGFNSPLDGEPHKQSYTAPAPLNERPQLAAGIETDHLLRIKGDGLSIRFYVLDNPRQVIEAFWETFSLPENPPPDHFFSQVLWTTWAQFKNDISHEKIFDLAENIADYEFNCGHLGIDAKWQDEFGSTRFDPTKFPNPKGLIGGLHQLGLDVTLWCIPFFNENSQHFHAAIDKNLVFKNLDQTPYIAEWWEGMAAFLDVTNPEALQWHLDKLQRLADEINLDGFKFDAGEGTFYAANHLHIDYSPNKANQMYIDTLSKRFPWSDVRSGWQNQSAPMLFRQWDKSSAWGFDNGLASCITQAITLNMLGYPYSFPDMIGGNKYGNQQVTAELLIRWTQAMAPMPIIQFSLAPWEYGEECAQICAEYAQLHGDLSPYVIKLASEKVPIVRPIWWLAPNDETALTCADQYLIGDQLLVAPVIQEGARWRDIYFPSGTWRSYWNPDEVYPAGWVYDYPAPIDMLPLFERVG